MRKWLPLKRLQQVYFKAFIASILGLIALIQFFACYGYYNYDCIPRSEIEKHIYLHANPNLVKRTKPDCRYEDIYQKYYPDDWQINGHVDGFLPHGIVNGSFIPKDCNPLISVAILVTYRKRQKQLDIFIPYIHNFLRKQNIHYKVYVIEQQDDKPFNKGLLYNAGARRALEERFPCLILHDVDLLPVNAANIYSCLSLPRHMSASIDKFRLNLPYESLTGGVLAIRADHFRQIDGFSNRFQGWGGEDDDLALRLRHAALDILRLPPEMSRYRMLVHRQERKNAARHRLLKMGPEPRDGFRAPDDPAPLASVTHTRLYALIRVRT
ncbi:beta-1,4-N-acetylgalactosaminyltransferase bre-4-like [Pieris brassicae]|uniref:Beta-1,4-N-acetylgalactosaminyltransferase n=1 Tax=Pieris brassicae TaxID=7116 RepID=A0A9P0T4N3_PIEBR|nr:beta-1,4-N-acetylgalactosaminyltransferase bre-4-like [Pieris brassicae]XP_045520257.1 beta-1,4-N-acetylgalactosaminyltransferase bre-4-like [Pieris brassicae]CAH3999426.1 unnamed protein product [Pieris brassicae]